MSKRKEYIPIFVGSTYSDLIEYRKTVMGTLHKLKTIVNGMEYFGSKPGSPLEECLNVVRDSQIYIGIFAMRYGTIDEESGQSFTHLEYIEAQKLKLPSLIYIIDEERQPILTKHIDTGKNASKLSQLKEELKRKFMVSFFTTPEDLAIKISQDLPPLLQSIGITVDEGKFSNASIEESLKKFENRPKKYAGSEVIVTGKLETDFSKPFSNTIQALGLTLGDTLKSKLYVETLKKSLDVYAKGQIADELESVNKGDVVTVKLKLLFGVEKMVWIDEEQDEPFVERSDATGFEIMEFNRKKEKDDE